MEAEAEADAEEDVEKRRGCLARASTQEEGTCCDRPSWVEMATKKRDVLTDNALEVRG